MPFSQKAEIKIVAINDLQGMGDTEGPGLVYAWSPPSPFPPLLPWLILLVLLALPANRTSKAWWIALPMAVLGIALFALRPVLEKSGIADLHQFVVVYKGLVFGAAAVWLLLPYLKKNYRIISILLMLLTWVCMAGGTLLLTGGLSVGFETLALAIAMDLLALFLVLALTFAALLCRKRYDPLRLSIWSAVFLALLPLLAALPILLVARISGGYVPLGTFMASALGFGAGCYAVLLPFLLLAFLNSHYRAGLKGLFHLSEPSDSLAEPPIPPTIGAPENEPVQSSVV